MRVRLAVAAAVGAALALGVFGWGRRPSPTEPSRAALELAVPRSAPSGPARIVRPLSDVPAPSAPRRDRPADEAHDPAHQEWLDLDHRVRAFLGAPVEPAVPSSTDPDAEAAAIEAALNARLDELTALEAELIAVAEDTSRPRRSLEATVTLGELYADMGASVEQLPAPAGLRPRQAMRWARDNDARAAVHFDKARLLLDVASANGGLSDADLAERIAGTAAAAAPR